MSTTAANAHAISEAHHLLHGGEKVVWCDVGYQGVHRREEKLGREVDWQAAMRPGKRRGLEPRSGEALAEQLKAWVRARVEFHF
jgi:IS5 family transposase